jgi:hypothetical protein
VNSVEEISTLSDKVDALMKLVASKNTPIDPNDVPLSTLIEQNNDHVDANFVSRNNFGSNAYRGNFNARLFPENSSNNYDNSYNNNNRMPSDLESNIKEFISSQKNFNAMIKEKLNRVDELARNMDKIAHDVENAGQPAVAHARTVPVFRTHAALHVHGCRRRRAHRAGSPRVGAAVMA